MKVYFIRHGQTNANREHRAMGQRDDQPLNEIGNEQAREVAKVLPKDFDILISSPLKRAFQTAEYISREINLPIMIHTEIAERDNGKLSGQTWDEIITYTNGQVTLDKLWGDKETDFSPWGGETIEQVRNRLDKFLAHVRKEFQGKKVLVVTHNGILRVLYKKYNLEPKEMGNTALHEFEI